MTVTVQTLAEVLKGAEVFVDGDWVESKDQDPNGDVRLVQLADIGDGYYVDKSNRFLTSDTARRLKCTFLEAGDILVARMPDPIGRACIFPGDSRPCVTVVDVCIVRVKESEICARWLMHTLNSPLVRNQIAGFATGTTRSRVSRGNLSKIKLIVPPLLEQRRLATILDKADALRTKRREALAQLDRLAQSIFVEILGDVVINSKGWPIASVGDVADVQGGLQVTAARKNHPNEVPYLRVANVYRGSLDLSEIKTIRATDAEIARTKLLKNDLLIVEGHGNPSEIGRGALWDGSISDCIHQNHIIRARFNSEKINPLYACEYLNSPGGRRHLLRAGKTTSGLNTISVSDVRRTPVALPPMSLQLEFAQQFAALERIKAAHRASMTESDTFFASLQHRAFRGEL